MVTSGDTVTATFTSDAPISDVEVAIAGQAAEAASDDGLNWTATTTLETVTGGQMATVDFDYTTADGVAADTFHGTADGSKLFVSDERDLVDLAGLGQVVDINGAPAPGLQGHANTMTDGNLSSASDVRAVGGEYYLVWDFGEGGSVSLDRAELRPRQDGYGLSCMWNQVLEGSNELKSWTRLTDPSQPTHDWQNLPSLDDGSYRYLRVSNLNIIGIAELRFYGPYRIDIDSVPPGPTPWRKTKKPFSGGRHWEKVIAAIDRAQ